MNDGGTLEGQVLHEQHDGEEEGVAFAGVVVHCLGQGQAEVGFLICEFAKIADCVGGGSCNYIYFLFFVRFLRDIYLIY